MAEDREGRLTRWSRLKRAGSRGRGGAAPVATPDPQPDAAPPDEAAALATPEPAEADAAPPVPAGESAPEPGDDAEALDLPTVESLDGESDYTPFLAQGVPEHLKRAALRKLWRSNPVFAVRDGLDDYDEDYTIAEEIASALTSDRASQVQPKGAEEKTAEAGETSGETADSGETAETAETAAPERESVAAADTEVADGDGDDAETDTGSDSDTDTGEGDGGDDPTHKET